MQQLRNKHITLGEIAKLVGGEVKGDENKQIYDIVPFDAGGPDYITFAVDKKYKKRLNETKAAAIIVPTAILKEADIESGIDKALIGVDNPYLAFAKVATFFHPHKKPEVSSNQIDYLGVNFQCGEDSIICPGAVVMDNVTVGNRVSIYPGVILQTDVVIGDDTIIYPNVTIMDRCRIGNRVIIQSGSVIGSDGFGFAPDGQKYHKIPQMGIVQIDDDVEIGANNTIDRATFGKTWIKKGVKTDNQVHIAHNVEVGENSVIVAQVGIAGSTKIGKHGVIAGQAGIGGHLTIGENVTIGPKAGVAKSVEDNKIVSGNLEMPHAIWLRVQQILPTLPELKKKIMQLEKWVQEIREKA